MRTITKNTIAFERKYTQKRIEKCKAEIDSKRKSIQEYIDRVNANIAKLEESISAYTQKLNDLDELEIELEEYEKRPLSEKTMRKHIYKNDSTIDIMDEFEEVNEKGFRKYERMIVTNSFSFSKNISFSLIVERNGGRLTVGNITMTEFKQGNIWRLIAHAKVEISKQIQKDEQLIKDNSVIMFNKPYLLRAQNSSNRRGYGNIYHGEDLVYEGTLYGETTSYAFVGAIMRNKSNNAFARDFLPQEEPVHVYYEKDGSLFEI